MSEKDRDWYWQQVRNQNQPPPEQPPRRDWRALLKPLPWLLVLALLIGAGTALWRNPAGQHWLQERWILLQSRLGLAPEGTSHAPAASRYSDSPRRLSECIKPGNVIDDDVRACVKGYRPKTW
ncbi:hypothetical protein NK553_21500 [Pseudomonas sp. ZM23]|uniref:Uncharacterized protein n=1 Tax=Pseudomonas triclosanedens TaxID=2961893 RepID=A0ABY6ZTN0_9PSED|nr:hypothetical protein [Pseudomonas triclosanedens]MCP8466535.1 hypothetical protein [Pseudomonas triclosanedens]MCP8472110.1 hypothetical protein [Pseudomonas triclosanedens]MCP8474506.1 hypothetical protein [Pseudomonas triclosanedens]WAI48110.1 hypothetical protein OU419_20430 [Pseudomonas triclosanedens]